MHSPHLALHPLPCFWPLPSTEINLQALILHPLVILKAINEIILESPGEALPGSFKSRNYCLAYALLLPMKSAAIRQIPNCSENPSLYSPFFMLDQFLKRHFIANLVGISAVPPP